MAYHADAPMNPWANTINCEVLPHDVQLHDYTKALFDADHSCMSTRESTPQPSWCGGSAITAQSTPRSTGGSVYDCPMRPPLKRPVHWSDSHAANGPSAVHPGEWQSMMHDRSSTSSGGSTNSLTGESVQCHAHTKHWPSEARGRHNQFAHASPMRSCAEDFETELALRVMQLAASREKPVWSQNAIEASQKHLDLHPMKVMPRSLQPAMHGPTGTGLREHIGAPEFFGKPRGANCRGPPGLDLHCAGSLPQDQRQWLAPQRTMERACQLERHVDPRVLAMFPGGRTSEAAVAMTPEGTHFKHISNIAELLHAGRHRSDGGFGLESTTSSLRSVIDRPDQGVPMEAIRSNFKVERTVHGVKDDRVDGFDVAPTTVMLRNIPNCYNQAEVLEEIEALGFEGTFDYLYCPRVGKASRNNISYVFINFLTFENMVSFVDVVHGKYIFKKHQSAGSDGKKASVSIARVQGLSNNLEQYMQNAEKLNPEEREKRLQVPYMSISL
eukprot:TRINITY_DN88_c0_g1_i5.p1 TRINITY_DN88_c0_g1~~TRINITY_DN88_c0_g1_i5.p1  ORF type:complete len:499 (+),score=53.31 TRINITY_DN88_c0_g1_i5:194-1690(+)